MKKIISPRFLPLLIVIIATTALGVSHIHQANAMDTNAKSSGANNDYSCLPSLDIVKVQRNSENTGSSLYNDDCREAETRPNANGDEFDANQQFFRESDFEILQSAWIPEDDMVKIKEQPITSPEMKELVAGDPDIGPVAILYYGGFGDGFGGAVAIIVLENPEKAAELFFLEIGRETTSFAEWTPDTGVLGLGEYARYLLYKNTFIATVGGATREHMEDTLSSWTLKMENAAEVVVDTALERMGKTMPEQKEEPASAEYIIIPEDATILGKGKIEFKVEREVNGERMPADDVKVGWHTTKHESVSVFAPNKVVGKIDLNSGVFETMGLGKCTVVAIIDSADGSQNIEREVNVRCPTGEEAVISLSDRLDELKKLYMKETKWGPIYRNRGQECVWEKGKKALGASAALTTRLVTVPVKGLLEAVGVDANIDKEFSTFPGSTNNLIANFGGGKAYDNYNCDGCQLNCLQWLDNEVKQNPDRCYLLDGLQWGPIWGSGSGHYGVVVFPEGSNWEETGTVFDAWPGQSPETFTIQEWAKLFPVVAGDSDHKDYKGKFATTTPAEISKALSRKSLFWKAWDGDPLPQTPFFGTSLHPLYRSSGYVMCPVNLLITDSEGRQSGITEDGFWIFDIPDCLIVNNPDSNDDNNWYFELDSRVASEYDLEITALQDGDFELITTNYNDKSLSYYPKQSITRDQKAKVAIDLENSRGSLSMPDGTIVKPEKYPLVVPKPTLVFRSSNTVNDAQVNVPIFLEQIDEPIGNLDMTLSYDSAVLRPLEISKGSLATESMIEYNILEGEIKISLIDNVGFSGHGSIVYVACEVIGKENSSTSLTIDRVVANSALDYASIDISTSDGILEVIGLEDCKGDFNGDGQMTAFDALCALKMEDGDLALDLILDVAGDGKVTERDAAIILENSVQMD